MMMMRMILLIFSSVIAKIWVSEDHLVLEAIGIAKKESYQNETEAHQRKGKIRAVKR